jgi:hypothetical protein
MRTALLLAIIVDTFQVVFSPYSSKAPLRSLMTFSISVWQES